MISFGQYTTKKSCATVIDMYVFFVGGKNETYIHLEQPFNLLTNAWKYNDCAFGPEVAGRTLFKLKQITT